MLRNLLKSFIVEQQLSLSWSQDLGTRGKWGLVYMVADLGDRGIQVGQVSHLSRISC